MSFRLDQIDGNKDFPNLRNAPIVEAVLHWQAAASKELQIDQLRQELSHEFQDYELAPQQNIQAELKGSKPGMQMLHSTDWIGFRLTKREAEKAAFVCQFKKDGLIFSRLAPYHGWRNFAKEGLRFWNSFLSIAEPKEIGVLTTRYISQIPLKSVDESTRFVPLGRKPLSCAGVSPAGFFHQDTMTLDEAPYTLNVIRAVQPTGESLSLIVDIAVSTSHSISDFEEVEQKLEELRYIKNEAFFDLMVDAEKNFGGKE